MRMKEHYTEEVFPVAQVVTPAQLASYGLETFTYETDCGLTLNCELEFDEGDASVGLNDSATLISAMVGKYDIAPVIGLRLVDMIESAFLNQPRESAWD